MKSKLLFLSLFILFIGFNLTNSNSEVIKLDDYEYYEPITLVYVVGGYNSAAAISDDGRVFTWGNGDNGILGTGNTNSSGSPQDITASFGLNVDEEVTQIAVGYSHMLALTNQNRVFGWGKNTMGSVGDNTEIQRNSPVDITANFSFDVGEDVVDIAAGIDTSYVITDDGKIFIWGTNTAGQLGNAKSSYDKVVTDQSSYFSLEVDEQLIDIDVNLRSILALSNQGNLYAWGNNLYGELGTGDTTQRTTAVNVTSIFSLAVGEEISAFSIGEHHSIVATDDGNVYTLGANNYGQIGDGTAITRTVPVNVSSQLSLGVDEYVTDLDCHNHNLVVTNLGRVFSWGNNYGDQVSDGLNTTQITPYEITSLLDYNDSEMVTMAATTLYNSMLLSNQNAFYVWGNNDEGILAQGVIDSSLDTGTPIKIVDTFNKVFVKQFLYGNINTISSYGTHTMVLTDSYRIYAWGNNLYGQIGNGTTTRQKTPLDITEFIPLNQDEYIDLVEVGSYHSVILTSDSRVFTWGSNFFGELGNGTKTSSSTPIDITSFIPLGVDDYIIDIYTASGCTFLVSNDNKVYSFGQNTYGQLGDGTKTHRTTPTEITSNFSFIEGETVIKIVGSTRHTMLYTSENNIYTWGENEDGALGNNTTVDSTLPILINPHFAFNPGETIENIDVGNTYSGLLSSDGRVFMWGENIYGSLGEGSGTNRLTPYDITNQFDIVGGEIITYLSIGGNHSIVHTSLGKTFAWGDNGYAQLGDNTKSDRSFPVQTTSFMDIGSDTLPLFELGDAVSYIRTVEGNIYGFGRNNYNEVGIVTNDLSIYPTEKISSLVTDLGLAHFSSMVNETLESNPVIGFEIYLEYDLYYLLDTITISSVVYDSSSIEYDKGKIVVNIPNTYSSGDNPTFTYEQLTLSDSTVHIASGPVNQETNIVIDTSPPTFDTIENKSFEVGGSFNGDINQFITNLTDDFDEDVDIEIIEELDIQNPGEYEISVTATDDSTNETTQSFTISMVDTTPPIIVFNRSTVFEAILTDGNIYLSYIDITDNVTTNPGIIKEYTTDIDLSTVGTYEIVYTVTDYYDNTTVLNQIVTVVDTTAPYFTLIPTQYEESGSTSDVDWSTLISNITDNSVNSIIISEDIDNVDYNTPGIYTVTVSATDEYDNTYQQTFSVVIEDTTLPLFDDIIDQTIEAGDYTDVDWSTLITNITDNSLGDLLTYETTDNVLYNIIGTYSVSVSVEDISHNITTFTFDVTVEDTTPPLIILNGNSVINIILGESYTEQGATVIDNEFTELDVIVSGDTVTTGIAGTYTVTYNVQDVSSNNATEVTRTIIISDTIILFAQLDSGIDSIGIDETFVDGGVEVFSLLETTIETVSTLDTSIAGTYTVTYTITDTNNNEIILVRYVTVYEKTPSITFLLAEAKTTISLNETYQDGICKVLVNNTIYNCVTKTNNVNTSIAGIYTITYSYTINEIEYTYNRYVFVDDETSNLTLYYRKKEEGDYL